MLPRASITGVLLSISCVLVSCSKSEVGGAGGGVPLPGGSAKPLAGSGGGFSADLAKELGVPGSGAAKDGRALPSAGSNAKAGASPVAEISKAGSGSNSPSEVIGSGGSAAASRAGTSAAPPEATKAGSGARPAEAGEATKAGSGARPAEAGETTKAGSGARPAEAGEATKAGSGARPAEAGEATKAGSGARPAEAGSGAVVAKAGSGAVVAKAGSGAVVAKAGSGAVAMAGSGAPKLPDEKAGGPPAGAGSAGVKAGNASEQTKPGAAAKAGNSPEPLAPTKPAKLTAELAAIKLSLLPNWDRDVDEPGSFQYVVRIKGTQNTKTFVFRYGYDDPKVPLDREQYKKYLLETRTMTGELRDRQRGSAWFIEGADATGSPAFRYIVLHGGKRLICYGSLYKDAESSKLGDDRDQTVIQAKQICETLAL
jgi:hypothetical protein